MKVDGVPMMTERDDVRATSAAASKSPTSFERLRSRTPSTTGYRLKRPVDLLLGVPLAVLATPLIGLLMLVSAIRFRARPLFVHGRVGWNGRQFPLYKIRSLSASAPQYADREELIDVEICRWGRFIRHHHFDELPQLWQVVRGDLALVGPRPMIDSIVDRMHPAHQTHRHSVRPGVTGLWQVSEARERLVLEAAEYDRHYVEFASLKLDLWILWVTLKQTLGASALTPADMPSWVKIQPVPDPDG